MNAAYLKRLQETCPCGREHHITLRDIVIESGALYRLNDVINKHGFTGNGYVICDENTYREAGSLVCQVVNTSNKVVLKAENLHANEAAVEEVTQNTKDADYYIAVGTGTIHDITRYVAHQKNLQFISVPTGASVDGFVSTLAAMTLNGMKITLPAHAPLVMVADLDIIAAAPYRLTCAGVGDILGKYIALADWKIAHIVTGEYFCQKVYDLEASVVADVVSLLDDLKAGKKEAYAKLMEALVVSGLAMQMTQNSRPASGVEHHISHLWELHVLGNKYDALHGEKVGIATAMADKVYKKFLRVGDLTPYMKPYYGIDPEAIRPVFGKITDYVIKENQPDSLLGVDPNRLVKHFSEVKEVIRALPEPEEIIGMLRRLGANAEPSEIQIDEEMVRKTLKYCVFARNRLSFYRMTKLMDTDQLGLY